MQIYQQTVGGAQDLKKKKQTNKARITELHTHKCRVVDRAVERDAKETREKKIAARDPGGEKHLE